MLLAAEGDGRERARRVDASGPGFGYRAGMVIRANPDVHESPGRDEAGSAGATRAKPRTDLTGPFAARAAAVQPFQAMEFGKRADELEARGVDVVRMSLGEPDFGAAPLVLEAMQRALREPRRNRYTAALGVPALREAIAADYAARFGVDIDPGRIVVTAGASAALLLAAAALVQRGDEVLVADPSYPCNRHFVSAFDADVRLVPTTPATRFQLTDALVREHWSERARGVMVATPSNPTGTSIPHDELVALCASARERGGFRLVDEIYQNLVYTDAPRTVLGDDDGAIVVNSFSKYFAMTGWRLGWAVLPEPMVAVVEKLAQNFYICPSAPAQHAAVACFESESLALYEERRAEFRRRRARVLAGLRAAGLPVPVEPDGAFYVYIDVSGHAPDAMTFAARALDEAHVALTPGADFGTRDASRYVRLSYANSMDEIDEAMVRLKAHLSG